MSATTTARSARLGLHATPEQEAVLRHAGEVARKSLTATWNTAPALTFSVVNTARRQ